MDSAAECFAQESLGAFRARATGKSAQLDRWGRLDRFLRHAWFVIKHGILSLSLAGIVFGRHASSFVSSSTAYYYHWELQDGLAFLANMVLFAGLLLGLSFLRKVATSKIAILLLDLGFLLILADGLLSCLCPPKFPWLRRYEAFNGAVLLGLTVAVLLIPPASRARMVGFAKGLVLVLFPIPVVIAAVVLDVPEWGPRPRDMASPVPARPAAQGHPVFLVVFDEWSFDRTTRDGEFLASLKNLRALSEQSLWFTQAYSRSFHTETSLPAILYQTDETYVVASRGTFWQSGDKTVSTSSVPSLFQRARDCGYRTTLLGFYHPYDRVLEGQIDDCKSHCSVNKGTSFLERMAGMAAWTPRTLTDPLLRRFGLFVNSPRHRGYWFELNNRLLTEVEGLVTHCSPNTFAVVHWPCPHEPFVYDRNGDHHQIGRLEQFRVYAREVMGSPRLACSPAAYDRAIHQMDRYVGRLVAALRASGKYDDAMIILTADHSWRSDPLPRTDRAKYPHVPLVIKMPRQITKHVIDRPVVNYRIQELIEGVFRDGMDAEGALDLIAAGRLPGPIGQRTCDDRSGNHSCELTE